ncbi:MAG: Lrp/AsnC family transcriptional regulator [Anaerofustis stercorihominis]|nr:Lrp/AsnC family transcriptional regulator [Anaerofustis stercorihominis]
MDNIDYKIIEILSSDGRITMKELSHRLSLSAPAVAERVKRLEQNGVITSYKAVINRSALGQTITVLINVECPAMEYDKFTEFADGTPEISEFYYVTGQHSLIVKAYVTSTEHLAKLVESLQAFGQTETFVVMYTHVKDNIF